METPMNQAAQPNWYADPADPTIERYWDGLTWTQHTRPVGGIAPVASTSNTWSLITMILSPFALVFSPLLFGLIGLVTGLVARNKGEQNADRALKILGIAALAGIALSALASAVFGG